jgi:hypothetical protein
LRPSVVTDGEKPHNSEGVATQSNDSTPAAGFPNEPFPCPACGQMLGPSCRVCVACKRPIDPLEIKRLEPPAGVTFEPRRLAAQAPPLRFAWSTFLIVLLLWFVLAAAAERLLGPVRSQWLLGSVVLLTSAWVYYDANSKRVPKPLRWGAGSLLLWIVVFPWYVARRRDPVAPCRFEVEVAPTRLLLALFLILVLLGIVTMVLKQLGLATLPGGH